ncbi:glycosyltransferase [Gammaproteobacteria bacterium]|nr:glycosyltransferase [Gammaproteobacteria bacterium]
MKHKDHRWWDRLRAWRAGGPDLGAHSAEDDDATEAGYLPSLTWGRRLRRDIAIGLPYWARGVLLRLPGYRQWRGAERASFDAKLDFDELSYLQHVFDGRAGRIDLLWHYLVHGVCEGRHPHDDYAHRPLRQARSRDELDMALAHEPPARPMLRVEGMVSGLDGEVVHGWARWRDYSDRPVLLDVYLDGQLVGSGLTRFRVGTAWRGFRIKIQDQALLARASSLMVVPRVGRSYLRGASIHLEPGTLSNTTMRSIVGRRHTSVSAAQGQTPPYHLITLHRDSIMTLRQHLASLGDGSQPARWDVLTTSSANFDAQLADGSSTQLHIANSEAQVLARLCALLTDSQLPVVICDSRITLDHVGVLANTAQRHALPVCTYLQAADYYPGTERGAPRSGWKRTWQGGAMYWTAAERECEWSAELPAELLLALPSSALESLPPAESAEQLIASLCLREVDAGKALQCIDAISVYTHASQRSLPNSADAEAGHFPPVLPESMSKRPWRVGFAVTSIRPDTGAGDYTTALELARALRDALNVEPVLMSRQDDAWYDLSDIDAMVSMLPDYDWSRITNEEPHLRRVAWARFAFDEWVSNLGREQVHQRFASCGLGCEHITKQTGQAVTLLPIATDPRHFGGPEPLRDAICATISWWGQPRQFAEAIDPDALDAPFELYGHGWDKTHLAPWHKGQIPYEQLLPVYRRVKLVIDDANHVTREWGSVNARVFDAIGAGALPLTNGEVGARELFGDLIPLWNDRQSLTAQINYFVAHEDERRERVEALRALVLGKHTYAHRAQTISAAILPLETATR